MSTAPEATPSGTRQRLEHVDAMRPIKQSAVISTHALIYFSPLSTSILAAGLLTLTHFSRDAFLFVSACMLAYSYRDLASVQLAHYWKRRFMAVGLPYLVWSVIYFPITLMKETATFPYYNLPMSAIFSGAGAHRLIFVVCTGYYHLYFLLVLLEFYVLQFVYPYVVSHGLLGFTITSKLETRLVFSYPLYLLGGVVTALYLEQFHDWVLRHKRALLSWTVVFGALPIGLDYLYRHGHHLPKILVPGADPFSALVVPYDVGAIIAVYLLGVYLVSPKRSARTKAITKSGSEAAYGIYLSQIIWIVFLHRWAYEWGILRHVPWLVMMLFAVTFAYLVGWLFSALVARTPFARSIVGRSRMPWDTLIPRRGQFTTVAHDDFGEGPLNLTDF